MSATLEIRGIQELKQALANLPSQLKGEATAIVLDSAHAAKDAIVAQYPIGPDGRFRKGKPITPGNLRKGVRVVVKEIGPFAVAAQVRSQAFHAHLWEFGTQARHYITQGRVWKNVGSMPRPPTPVFIPTMIRYRRAMYAQLAALLERHGLTVKRAA
jgi:hypothetical protein